MAHRPLRTWLSGEAGPVPAQGNIAQQIFWYTTFTADMVSPDVAVMDDEGNPNLTPTGTNVPDYPRMAPLWWQNLAPGRVASQRNSSGNRLWSRLRRECAGHISSKTLRITKQ